MVAILFSCFILLALFFLCLIWLALLFFMVEPARVVVLASVFVLLVEFKLVC